MTHGDWAFGTGHRVPASRASAALRAGGGARREATRCAAAALVAALLALGACTKAQREGRSSVIAVLDQLSAAAGVAPDQFGGSLSSDVQTYVKKNIDSQQVCVPTVFEDTARATFHLALKDPGSADLPTIPSSANTITFTRYHVEYRRADGRATPGVDVPYGFDGGLTVTLVGSGVSIGQLIVVRVQAKEEAPLKALIGGGGAHTISTIAEVTFYGTDQAGRAIVAAGFINVDFSDWADPDC